jgi:hypothetical protein
VSDQPISLAFFDTTHRLYGSARSGVAVIFDGDDHRVLSDPPELARDGSGWSAALGEETELGLEPASPPIELGGGRTWLCRVRGRVDGRAIDCVGAATETSEPPAWADLDAVRAVLAIFEEDVAVLASARRPRGTAGHGDEIAAGALLEAGDLRGVDEARISTVYDGDGRQRSASLELWLPAEDFPRRAAGTARAGVSLALEGLHVHLAMFTWRMEGREGAGTYELTVRAPAGAAA